MRHNMYGTRTHKSWEAMHNRCSNVNHDSYLYYGGRGITVCSRWKHFTRFYADMGERPEGTSLDRKDNDGSYEPSNCRWATYKEQAGNRRHPKIRFDNTSGIQGVSFYSRDRTWDVRYKGKYFGRYPTFEEACLVREKVEINYGRHNESICCDMGSGF